MPDSLDVDLKRHHVGGGDKLMFQGYEYYYNAPPMVAPSPARNLLRFSFPAMSPSPLVSRMEKT